MSTLFNVEDNSSSTGGNQKSGDSDGKVFRNILIIALVILGVVSMICVGLTIAVTVVARGKLNDNKSKDNDKSIEPVVGEKRKPYIGILGTRREPTTLDPEDYVPLAYAEAVQKAGGIPIILPPLTALDFDVIRAQFEHIDGLIPVGGIDVDPSNYNEGREEYLGYTNSVLDRSQIAAIQHASSKHIPILGICRGHQIINVVFGGSLWQDLSYNGGMDNTSHRQPVTGCLTHHPITIHPNTTLAKIFPGTSTVDVNSSHHQAVRRLADGFTVDAVSPDGIIESIHKDDENGWILGVQFHPERFVSCSDEWLPLFKELVNKARELII